MGFRSGAYAKIWKVDTHEKWSKCRISISHKNRATGKYEKDFQADVMFVANAHSQRPLEGQQIKITECDVTNTRSYTNPSTGQTTYPVNYTVFAYELQDDRKEQPAAISIDSIESDMPF